MRDTIVSQWSDIAETHCGLELTPAPAPQLTEDPADPCRRVTCRWVVAVTASGQSVLAAYWEDIDDGGLGPRSQVHLL